MELVADRISVAGSHVPLLPPTSLVAPPRRTTLVVGDPGPQHVALGLALAGRVRLATGTVSLDGDPATGPRRRHVQLVDTEGVSAPDDSIPVEFAVSEQLALAGRPSGRGPTHELLERLHLDRLGRARFETVDATTRALLLMDIAACRSATRVLVLTHPDRFGGEPEVWWRRADELAAEGLTVIVQSTHATAELLGVQPDAEIGVSA